MTLNYKTESITVDGKPLYGALTELENAVFALFWEGENPRLGSVTVTLPNKEASQLLGDRNEFLGRLLGERLVVKYGKIAMVSTNLSVGFDSGKTLIELADKLAGVEG